MKFVILFALIAAACADVSELSPKYLPPQAPQAPAQFDASAPAPVPAPAPVQPEAPAFQQPAPEHQHHDAPAPAPAAASFDERDGYNYQNPSI